MKKKRKEEEQHRHGRRGVAAASPAGGEDEEEEGVLVTEGGGRGREGTRPVGVDGRRSGQAVAEGAPRPGGAHSNTRRAQTRKMHADLHRFCASKCALALT